MLDQQLLRAYGTASGESFVRTEPVRDGSIPKGSRTFTSPLNNRQR